MRFVLVFVMLVGCTNEDQSEADCTTSQRLVHDVCTKLGPDDGCVESHDVCIALCDNRTSCTTTGGLRPLTGWPTAPNGYCVECVTP